MKVSDMLIKLYDGDFTADCPYRIIRVMTPNKYLLIKFVKDNFSEQWASECEACFAHLPTTCFAALNERNEIIGFAAYEATCKAFFGPLGVLPEYRKQGVGAALLKSALQGLKELGYAYAVIGGVEEKNWEFYRKAAGAVFIEGAGKSIYKDLI